MLRACRICKADCFWALSLRGAMFFDELMFILSSFVGFRFDTLNDVYYLSVSNGGIK
jgi:hypothetical protein